MSAFLKTFAVLLAITGVLFVAIFLKGKQSASNETSYGCQALDISGMPSSDKIAYFENKRVSAPLIAGSIDHRQVLAVADPRDRWIEVNLTNQILRAWDGDKLYLETSISSGLPATPTPVGEFKIWAKLRATKMEGYSSVGYYNLPNVPYVMFMENEEVPGWRGYGLHGTYWHNDFGNPRSNGCVNLPTPIAEKLYQWVSPDFTNSQHSVFADESNPGTRVIIHK